MFQSGGVIFQFMRMKYVCLCVCVYACIHKGYLNLTQARVYYRCVLEIVVIVLDPT